MNAIKDVANDLWYRTPGKDRRLSRRISAEVYRYEQIEKTARALLEARTPEQYDECRKALRKALRLSTDAEV